MKGAAKVFNGLILIFVFILIFWFFQIDYNNLSFEENSNAYFGIFSILLMVFAIQFIKRSIDKNHKE